MVWWYTCDWNDREGKWVLHQKMRIRIIVRGHIASRVSRPGYDPGKCRDR